MEINVEEICLGLDHTKIVMPGPSLLGARMRLVLENNFYPMTGFNDGGVVGHLIMRFTDEKKKILRFGFGIVDDFKRGMGYGKEMLKLALKYSFEILKVEKVTLGVFDNNMAAYYCYKAVGFREAEMAEEERCNICGETWRILELEIGKREYEDR